MKLTPIVPVWESLTLASGYETSFVEARKSAGMITLRLKFTKLNASAPNLFLNLPNHLRAKTRQVWDVYPENSIMDPMRTIIFTTTGSTSVNLGSSAPIGVPITAELTFAAHNP
ncbi:hypothetical protein [Corynebacterium glutamicum]|uniref:hypothetical protein n=1 Tax=Corynebacterium glutamicum TaxID=1718 RepID=UPI001B8ACAFE|nr:hypothetical protein [Corynebacterium glutamicum]